MIPSGVAPQPILREAAIPGMASKIYSCLYWSPSLFIPVSCLQQRWKPIHTSGPVGARAWKVCKPPWSNCGVACGIGGCSSAILVAARVQAGIPSSAWVLRCPTPWVAGSFCLGQQLRSGAACLGERRGAAAGI